MIQPILAAINYFNGFVAALPFSVQAFLALTAVMFGLAVIITVLFKIR